MRQIRSVQALKTFEAAARHLSFKYAAQELFVTPTAVSHQIKALETELGYALFKRKIRQIELTNQGYELFNTLRKAFDDIDETVNRIESRSKRNVVTLGLGPIIGARWLAPRLGDFWKNHHAIDLRLHHITFPLQKSADLFDLAIAWGDGRWPHMEVTPFIKIKLTPVMSPQLPQPSSAAELLNQVLIHERNRKGWQQWFAQAGVDYDGTTGTTIDDANLVLQTTLNGQGVSLGILPFIEEDLRSGKLIRPFDLSIDPELSYYLIYRKNNLDNPAVESVRDWLLANIQDSHA
jgi:LysR family glycine cleavage system transcriptional activator